MTISTIPNHASSDVRHPSPARGSAPRFSGAVKKDDTFSPRSASTPTRFSSYLQTKPPMGQRIKDALVSGVKEAFNPKGLLWDGLFAAALVVFTIFPFHIFSIASIPASFGLGMTFRFFSGTATSFIESGR
jgi:hypothetical protein